MAAAQILELCNQEFVKDSIIRIMPDTHAGAGCTIGTTMTVKDKIVPNLVGVDIGCGMETVKLKQKEVDLKRLDRYIHEKIPAGFNIRKSPHPYIERTDLDRLVSLKHVDLNRARLSVGTLGGGNHFIELNKDSAGSLYLVVHSGSRHLGKQVAEHYQEMAYRERLAESRHALEKKKHKGSPVIKPGSINKALAYLEGKSCNNYLADMFIVQQYAVQNRNAIVDEILSGLALEAEDRFTTIHNYIDPERMILRKGAVSALEGERLLIPINMSDGSLLCVGKGNRDWNWSAPHGAGRLMSRKKAKEFITMEQFEKSMRGIYSTTVNRSTLDECALAYKPMEEIIKNIRDTVEIIDTLKPLYNFKAAE